MLTRRETLGRFVGALVVSPPYVDRRRDRVPPGPAGEAAANGQDAPRIGYFGPRDSLYQAVLDGCAGTGLQVIQKWTADPWRAGGRLVVEMAYQDRVAAIIGSVDAAATHIAEQVAVKARVPLVDAVSTDGTTNAAMVPWMFNCQPADAAVAAAVAGRLLEEQGGAGFTLVSSTGHDDRMLAREFLRFLGQRNRPPERHVEFAPGQTPALEAGVVLVAANAADSAEIVRRLPGARVYGGPSCGRRQFLRAAGRALEGVRYPVMGRPALGLDYAEAQSEDAARMLASAIVQSDGTREGIRAALERVSPWQGRGGEIRWNALNRNVRPVACGVLSPGNEWESSVIKES